MNKTRIKHGCLQMACLCLPINLLAQSPLDKRIDQLVSAMSPQEKIDQLRNSSFGGTPDNVRLGIPGFFMDDGPHGVRFASDKEKRPMTAFPTGMGMAATWDEAIATKVGEGMGLEFWAYNRNQQLGPCIDIARDPRGGRTAESSGEDPYLSGHIAKSVAIGIQKNPVIATVKHYMGESKQLNRHGMKVEATDRWLMDFAGYNFRTVVQDAGVLSIMGAYNLINGNKCCESLLMLQTILRNRWGFPFYVVSDWDAIWNSKKAIEAGTDVCMGSNKYEKDLPGLVASGEITTQVLDKAVKNVLRTKILNGLLDYYPQGNASYAASPENKAVSKLAAQKSLILLKNQANILPLKKSGIRIALIGPNAKGENLNCFGSSETFPKESSSIMEGLVAKIGAENIQFVEGCKINTNSTEGFAEAIAAAKAADIVIFAGGLDATQEGEGYDSGHDRTGNSIALPETQQQLINELAVANPNLIAVIQSGGVCGLNKCLAGIKGLIYSFYAAQEAGNAIADVIFGDYNPAGRMPVSMPKQDSDLPSWDENSFRMFTKNLDGGNRWLSENNITPEFAFGFGLSYTSFSYKNFSIPQKLTAGQNFTASVEVTNTGSTAGEEVVQLYIGAPSSKTLWMPKKQLRGFKRIALNPGETKTVTFEFCADHFYHWDEATASYQVQPGNYTFSVGGSSDNLPLSQQVLFEKGVQKPDLRITQIYTMPRYPKEGERVSFYALVKNQGNAAVSEKYDLSFAVDGKVVAQTTKTGINIAPGQVQLIASKGEWKAMNIGKICLSGNVSFKSADTEWNTKNNGFARDFEVFKTTPNQK